MAELDVMFAAVDATGAGIAVLREDGTLQRASAGFCELLGANGPLRGAALASLAPALPDPSTLGSRIGPDSPVFVHGSFGRHRRMLAAAQVELGELRLIILADRTQQTRARVDLASGGEARTAPRASDSPRPARIRPMSEMGERTAHALALARRYRHDVTVIRLEISAQADVDLDGIVLGCVRGVDDVGRTGSGRYLLLLPDTDVQGAKIVGKRICTKLQGHGAPSLGIAQSQIEEGASALLERAEQACSKAGQRGGGVFVAPLRTDGASAGGA